MNDNFYKQLVKESPIGYAYHRIISDDAGIPYDYEFIEVNPTFEMFTGLRKSDVIGKTLSEKLSDIKINEFDWIEFYGEIALKGGKQKIEQYFESVQKWYSVNAYSHEKDYIITQLIDITKAETDLENQLLNKTQELENFFSVNLDLLCIADTEGNFLKVNKEWENVLGYSKEELEKRKFLDFVHPDDIEPTLETMSKLGSQEQVLNFVNRYRCMDGSYRYIEWRSQPHGNLIYAAARDITERQQSEEVLNLLKEEYQMVFHGTQDSMFLVEVVDNNNFRYIRNNKTHQRTTGITTENLRGKTPQELVGEDLGNIIVANYKRCVQLAAPINYEETLELTAGERTWATSLMPIFRDKRVAYLVGSSQDITEKKQAEEALRENEERYRLLSDVTMEGIVIHKNGIAKDLNHSLSRLLGYEWEELLNKNLLEIIHEDDKVIVGKNIIKEYAQPYEVRVVKKDGQILFAELEARNLQMKGEGLRVAAVRDITERKQRELEKIAQEKFLQTILQTTIDGFWVINLADGRVIDCNDAYSSMSGYTRDELLGLKISDLDAYENQDETKARIRRIIENGAETFETYHRRKDGSVFDVEISVSFIKEHDKLVCFCRDITDRKRAEEALKESEEKYRLIFKHSPLGVIHFDHKGQITDCNENFVKIIGSSREVLVGLDMLKLPDIKLVDALKATLLGELTIYEDDYKSFSADKVTLVRGIFEPIRTDNHKIIGGVGIIEDISVRKRLEMELANEKKLLETTLISVGDGVISTDYKGNIVFLNKVAESLTGWTQQEAQGKYIEDVFRIVNEFTREKSENIVQKVLESAKTLELANHTLLISRDGIERPIEDSAAPIVQENGVIIGVVLVFRDFSEKKHKQEEILYLSYHDQLTGLYNRRFYEEELKRLDTQRNLPMTIVMADVNGLKLINDSFGHALGDELLKKAAEVIKRACRVDDIVARIGGDEFVILLPKTDSDKAAQIMKRIKEIISNEKVDCFDISISFGYETKHNEEEDIQEIFKNAEDFMYRNKLYESSSMRSKTINLIMNTLYEKSHREMLHSKRVSEICETIADKMDFNKDSVNQIRIAGLMHDIGKMGIDGKILNKPGGLNLDEWKEMKRHPEIGYRILSSSNEFSEIAEYVLAHQERWDGKGYPKGLKGEEISLQARIIAVADAFDAMTSDRSYRKKLSEEEAIAEIKRNAGTQFDLEIAKVYIEKVLGKECN